MPNASFREDRAAGLLILARGRSRRAETRSTGTRSELLEKKRYQIEIAARMAKAIEDSKRVAQVFDRLANDAGVVPTKARARPHIRLLRFLGVHAPGGSMPRHSDQIEKLLRTGLPASEFARVIARDGLGKHRRRVRRVRRG